MELDNYFEVVSSNDKREIVCRSPATVTDEIDADKNNPALQSMAQGNHFGEISSNDEKQTICRTPALVLDSLTDETHIDTNNHNLQSTEHNNCPKAIYLNNQKIDICSRPSTLLKSLTDGTRIDTNNHDNQSMDSESSKENISESDSLTCSNVAALDENLEDDIGIVTSNNTIKDMESESYLKEKCSESDYLTCSNDAELVENLEEVGITTSNNTILGIESESYLKEKTERDSLTCSNDAVLEENLEAEADITTSNSTIVNDESCTENEEEIKSRASKQKRKRDLINQSLSLPYYKMSRPDFHEFTNNVAKNLEVPMKGSQPLNFKHQEQILPLQKLQYPKKSLNEKQFVGDKEYADIVLCEGSSIAQRVPSSCSKTIKESYRLRREDLIQRLKDQMQKKKEAAFDRHKEIQQADEEICSSDIEEFDKVLDYDDSSSPTPSDNNEDSLASIRNPVSDSEDSCILPVEKECFESAVVSTSIEATHDLLSSDEGNCDDKYDASESLMDSPPVSLSIPSYQPNGGFIHESDLSSDSCNSDSEKVLPSKTNGSSQSFAVLRNSFDLDASQVAPFGLDEISTICSGRFLSMDEERPWTPSSDSQVNRREDLDVRCNDGASQDSEELEPDKSQLKEFDMNSPVDNTSKRKNCDNFGDYIEETFSPPLKKHKKDLILCESSGNPSSLKIDEIMQDVYEKSSLNVDNLSQNVCIKYHSSKELTDYVAEQQSGETLNDEDTEEIHVPRIRKCRPIIDDSDDDETNLPNNLQLIEALSQNQNGDKQSPLKINDFLDEEAELSGDDMSSDESDGDDGDDEAEQGLLPEDIPADEELKEQVASIHFKHERDDDARIVKRLQQDFLPEGELYFDGSGRQKKFHWSSTVSNNIQNEALSESEPEDNIESPMQQDKIKWRQETSVVQKCIDSDSSDVDDKEKTQNLKRLPVSIIGKALSSQTVFETTKHGVSSPFTRRHGSLIHVAGSEGLNLNVSSSVQRKTVLFQALSRSDKVNSSTSQALDGKSVFEKLL